MKKIIFSLASISILFASCSKEASNTTTTSSNTVFSNCVISKLILNDSSSINYLYNAENKVISVNISDNVNIIPFLTYTYVGNKIIETNLQSGGKPITTYFLNSMGYVDSLFMEPTINGIIDKRSTKYEYDINGYLTKNITFNYDSNNQVTYNNTTTYNYKNGNLFSTNESNGASSTYEFYSDLAQIPDVVNIDFGILFYGKKDKNLIKTYTDITTSSTYVVNYSYTKDASGKIIAVTTNSSSGSNLNTRTIGLQYLCK